jgi:hypothetical protein
MGARKCRSSQTCNKVVDGLDVRVQLGYNRGCVICDGHDHGRSSSSKMLVPRRGLSKETRGEQNCFIELWSLERLDDSPAEAFMRSPAHLTPPVPPSIWAHDSQKKMRRTESRNSGIPWLSHHRGSEQRQCCADGQSRFLLGGQADLLPLSGY